MNAVSATGKPPAEPLGVSRRQQSRIPGDRDSDASPVHQIDGQPILANVNIANPNVRGDLSQRSHATPPIRQCAIAAPREPLLPTRGTNPRLRATLTGSNHSFADAPDLSTWTCGGSLGSWL